MIVLHFRFGGMAEGERDVFSVGCFQNLTYTSWFLQMPTQALRNNTSLGDKNPGSRLSWIHLNIHYQYHLAELLP